MNMLDTLKNELGQLLEDGSVGLVIGYGERKISISDGSEVSSVGPVFLTKQAQINQLVWNRHCVQNLVTYLTKERPEVSGKIAIMVKPCDLKAIHVLCQEHQIERESLFIIGLSCNGIMAQKMGVDEGYLAGKCITCLESLEGSTALCETDELDFVIDTPPDGKLPPKNQQIALSLEELKKMSPTQRWKFWQAQFSKCLRCYACRAVCPMCYCKQCICDMSQPQWIEKSPNLKGNFLFHIVRAYHLSGRCTGCGECERACPMGLPLMLLNNEMIGLVRDLYDYEPGKDPQQLPLLSQFNTDDDQSFIK